MGALDDTIMNKRSESSANQTALIAKALMGEISMEEFRKEGEKIAANDVDITTAMNKAMAEAVKKYNLK